MAPLLFRKSSFPCLLVTLLFAASAQAVVVIEYGTAYGAIKPPPPAFANRSMPGIVMVPQAQTETGYLIQRSHAWRGNSRTDPRTGALLVYPARSGAIGAPSSERQVEVRSNISRAHAYRLDYYKR